MIKRLLFILILVFLINQVINFIICTKYYSVGAWFILFIHSRIFHFIILSSHVLKVSSDKD